MNLKSLSSYALLILMIACAGPETQPTNESQTLEAENNVEEALGYLKQNNPERALNKVLLALQQDPNLAEAYKVAGLIYQQSGQPALADKYFNRAVKLEPQSPSARNSYGKFLCQQARFKEAEENFLIAAKNPDIRTIAVAYTNAGLCALRVPDLDRAAQYFRAALEANPRMGVAYFQLARIYYQKERYPQAQRNLQTYLQYGAHTPKSLWLGIQIEKALGNRLMQERYARLLRETFPDSKEARKLLKTQP